MSNHNFGMRTLTLSQTDNIFIHFCQHFLSTYCVAGTVLELVASSCRGVIRS